MSSNLEYALDLMRRLPPINTDENLYDLCDLVPKILEELLSSVDQTLKIAHDNKQGKDFLLCDYNRDGDSYRSPWSNEYQPPFPDGITPSPALRELEIWANEAFDIYRELYFEGGLSSCYLWDTTDGLAGVVLIKKTQDQSKQGQPMRGTWDSIHVVEIADQKESTVYKLTSTIMLSIQTNTEQTGDVCLAGNLTRQEEGTFPVKNQKSHIANFGRMIENMENKLRMTTETIYFGKTKNIVSDLRTIMSASSLKARQTAMKNISTAISQQQ
ncbi:F-actin-capping protein subunit beta-like [Schistocerca gregaria]|uniref:F-actin-capping protein subunit beta-like n=1 Tax=Schistocerca gregaria TaxID=7010 RepID=UPI00211DBF7C|nr:F-actin-capping protein subunit beta-like [Schistocerca gregaria]